MYTQKKVLIRPNDCPWFTSELRHNIRIRDRLRQKAISSKSEQDKFNYKKQRNRVNNMKKYAKENFMNNFEDSLNNPDSNKTFWQIMGRFMGKQSQTNTIPPLCKSNDSYAFSDEEKVNLLNDYFCSISTIDDSNVELPAFRNRTDSSLSNIIIQISDVTDVLGILKVNKASGPDGISHRMLKYTCRTVAVPLCKLFNLSIQLHAYPDLWKIAHVMPIFKKGDKSLPSNYRPISLVSCVGKAFERVVYRSVYNHLVDHSLIYKYQSGFLPGHSTVHHLIELLHHTCTALENHQINCQVFCNISKAFDRVWHKGLILKLEKYGINGNLLLWFMDYLFNRSQKVFLNETFSKQRTINAGVPQGSVLGPLLFLIYINDISDELTGLARLFADDTSLSFSLPDVRYITRVLNHDLQTLSGWAKRWLIAFNPLKTEVMLISNIHIDQTVELVMDNTVLKVVDTHKHLGVLLSSNNKWTSHIDSIINSASKQVSFLRKIKYKFSRSTLNKLYCAYIRPLLEYASEVWDGCNRNDSNRLEKLQLNAARIVTGLPIFPSANSLYTETGWETLAERRKNKKLTLMYKIINNDAPSYLTSLLPHRVNEISNYNLTDNENFEIPFSRLCTFETSFFPSTLKLWNDLDQSFRNLPTLSQFKRRLKKQLIRSNTYSATSREERTGDIILSRIRHKCSSLQADLYSVNIVTNPFCTCRPYIENAEHFFFECSHFDNQRTHLMDSLSNVVNITLDLLLYANEYLTPHMNHLILLAVLRYIKESRRFSM